MAIDIYGGRDPRDLPMYTVTEGARYLDLPVSTLRDWVRGRPDRFEPVLAWPDDEGGLLSFTNIVEAHVLSALRRQHRVGTSAAWPRSSTRGSEPSTAPTIHVALSSTPASRSGSRSLSAPASGPRWLRSASVPATPS